MIEAELNELESRQMKEILKTTSTEKLVLKIVVKLTSF